jgi:Fur family ferric uptake transcriptional regulator
VADTVLTRVRDDVGRVSTQAVYDVLRTLTDHGIVRRIQPAGSAARYELRVGDNHHHVVCRSCGAVTDIDCATETAPCLEATDLHLHAPGFVVDEAEVTFWGLCPTCTSGSPAPTA